MAIAQDTQLDDSGIDTIIVTARNREESIQDVPLAITAFSQQEFRRRVIENLDDVGRLTAGLSFEDFTGGFASPIIRGQSQTRLTALEQNVSSFLDGVYLPRSWGIDLGTANLTRIEVVKGPQSARYGRNAFSGAINYVPYKAALTDEPISATLSGTIGSDERYDGGLRANIVLTPRLAVAGSFNYSTFDGTFDNDAPITNLGFDQGTDGNVGGFENQSYSGSVIYNPVDPLTLEFSYNRFDIESEARAGQNNSQILGDLNCGSPIVSGTGDQRFPLFCGELPGPDGAATIDPRAFGVFSETEIFRGGINLELSENLDLAYTFGQVQGDVETGGSSEPDQINCGVSFAISPFFGPPACAFTVTPLGGINYTTHELRFVYTPTDSLRLELGGFLSDGEDNNAITFPALPIIAGITDPSLIAPAADSFPDVLGVDILTELNSIFGAFEWTSADSRFKFAAEVRYSDTDIATTDLDAAVPTELTDNFSFITPRVTAEYSLTDETLVYATVARGAKAGGFNPTAALDSERTFDPEFNWTYELGLKTALLDNRLVVNGAVYYTDWSALQVNSPDTGATNPNATNIILNLADATVFGGEVEATFRLTENLTVDGTFSYANSEYDDGSIDNRFVRPGSFFIGTPLPACDGVVCDGDISGNDLERTPSTQATFGAEWEGDITPEIDYFIRGDLSYQNAFFASPVNLATIPSRTLVSASAGVSYKNLDVNVWARNLFDKEYLSNSFVIIIPFGNAYNSFFGDRRSYGLSATLNF